jgi:hypothetical protein
MIDINHQKSRNSSYIVCAKCSINQKKNVRCRQIVPFAQFSAFPNILSLNGKKESPAVWLARQQPQAFGS